MDHGGSRGSYSVIAGNQEYEHHRRTSAAMKSPLNQLRGSRDQDGHCAGPDTLTALGRDLGRIIDAQAQLDLDMQRASGTRRAELEARYEELNQQCEQLEYAIATLTAQDLVEAVIQLRLLASLLHCDEEQCREQSPNVAVMKDMLIQSIARVLEREAEIDRSAFAGRHYLGPS